MNHYNIIETNDELNLYNDCDFFSFSGEVHLAKVVSCYDGDTFYCIFKHNDNYKKFKIRTYGYDSPELKPSKLIPENERQEIKKKAKAAKYRLEELILNKNIFVFCKEFEKYGRILADIKLTLNDTKTINDIMIEEGHGYPYFGKTKHSPF